MIYLCRGAALDTRVARSVLTAGRQFVKAEEKQLTSGPYMDLYWITCWPTWPVCGSAWYPVSVGCGLSGKLSMLGVGC